ncbi:hypothetical protein AG4045_021517 [Apium graveolens]|uniref:Gnk2-homologous domain-containing protein n=1 Tax=Apium graveolens TaxID=4045 RepID=A0A6L5BA19_APIGR|nr:hypothetical protein AG4045_021517 [Apium graveolens]
MLTSLPQYSLLFLLFLLLQVKANMFMYGSCSQEKFQPNSPFETNFNSLLSSIVTSSSHALYNTFALGNDTSILPDSAIYGLYQCRGDQKVGLLCPYANGATLQLDTCLVRYEHFDFLGTLDTSLRFRKCSKSVETDVLADLQRAVGFRVSTSGLVEGLAQCLSDMSASDCGSCLSDAVGKLKSLCGSAEAADVFLAQCYARYWASGYYDSSPSSSNDDVGKTVAIIVGVVAGIAVVIVLLSFCRKACH